MHKHMIKSKTKNNIKTYSTMNNVQQKTNEVVEASETQENVELLQLEDKATKTIKAEVEVLTLNHELSHVEITELYNNGIKETVEVKEAAQDLVEQPEQAPQTVEEVKQEDEVDKSSKMFEEAVVEESKKITKASINIDEVSTTKTDDDAFLKKLSKQIKKQNDGLYAQVVNVGRGTEYIFIKPKNNVYCYARFVEKQRHQDSSVKWEIEFLANIPANLHSDILSIAHACGSSDSRRVFFNPSGML